MSAWRSSALLLTLVAMASPAHAQPKRQIAPHSEAQPIGSVESSPAPPPVRLQRGVVVVAAKHAPLDETWNLALETYRDPALRPRGMNDGTARALAGEAPPPRAAARIHELFVLRDSLHPDGASTRRLLTSIARELGVSGVVLVHQTKAGQPRARLFVVTRGDFTDNVLWPQPDTTGRPSWASSVAWLSSLTTVSKDKKDDGGSVFASAWFWGAVTAAAGIVIVGYVASRDEEPSTIHLQGRVNP